MQQYKIITIEETFEKAKKKINEEKKKNSNRLIGITGIDDELNRKILEKEKVDIFVPSLAFRKDFSKQRDSGFNQVLAKIAKKNEIIIGVNLDEVINSNKKEKAKILGRIKQNISLCKKNKLKITFVGNYVRCQDLKALGNVLGMPTDMPKFFN